MFLARERQCLQQYDRDAIIDTQFSILSKTGQLPNRQNQPEPAIVFLKASVEVREAIRGDIRGLETDLQQSFTDTVAADYRLLADLLLQQDRILEAQRVLDRLKVQELDDYLDDVQRNAQTSGNRRKTCWPSTTTCCSSAPNSSDPQRSSPH
ncbi:hypothetical protein [Halomicronema sp. CCY15110]|uniref:hypothetical protein n=1 Tax=Halomicronema sp. CCY15110 TaxID=2767773 RepID=UPI0019504C0A|nr:hypothetical protein [Halomicronema sp. CCY15110]